MLGRSGSTSAAVPTNGQHGKASYTDLGFDGTIAVLVLAVASTALGDVFAPVPFMHTGLRWLWAGVSMLAVVRLAQHHELEGLIWLMRTHLLLGALLLLTLASALWSPDWPRTLQRSISVISTTVIAVYIGSCLSRRQLLAVLIWYLFIVVTFAGVALSVLVPELNAVWAEDAWARLRGLAANKNSFGAVAGCALTVAVVAGGFGRIDAFYASCLGATAAFALAKADSATAFVATVGALALTGAAILSRRFARPVMVASFFWFGFLGLLLTLGLLFREQILLGLGRDATMTGRTDVWALAVNIVVEHPWLGVGYAALWGYDDSSFVVLTEGASEVDWNPVHAHNGLLQVATELGLLGAVLWLAYCGKAVSQAFYWFQRTGSVFGLMIFGLLSYVVISDVAEAHTLLPREPLWIIFVAMTSALSVQMRHVGASIKTRGHEHGRVRTSHHRKKYQSKPPGGGNIDA